MSPQTVSQVAGRRLVEQNGQFLDDAVGLRSELDQMQAALRGGSLADMLATTSALPGAFDRLMLLEMNRPRGSREDQARRVVNETFRDLRALRNSYIEASEHIPDATPLRAMAVNGSTEDGARCGYFQAVLADGTWGSLQRRPDDCFRAGLSTLLQCPMWRLPRVYPAELRVQGKEPDEVAQIVLNTYDHWLCRNDASLLLSESLPITKKRWLGIVGEGLGSHCVLLRGRDLIFDTGWVTPPGDGEPVSDLSVDDVRIGMWIDN